MEDAYISRIHEPGKIVANYTEAAFRKDNLNFIVLRDRREGTLMGTKHGTSVYARGKPMQVFLTVPSFEIHGEVRHQGQASPSNVLVQSLGQFQPLYNAEASAAIHPDIRYNGDLILVRKEHVGIFCLAHHKT